MTYDPSPGVQRLHRDALSAFAAHPKNFRGRLLVLPEPAPFDDLVSEQAEARSSGRRMGIAYFAPDLVVDASKARTAWRRLQGRNEENCIWVEACRAAANRGQPVSYTVCRGCEHGTRRDCAYYVQFRGPHHLRHYPYYLISMASQVKRASLVVIDDSTQHRSQRFGLDLRWLAKFSDSRRRFEELAGALKAAARDLYVERDITEPETFLTGRAVFDALSAHCDLSELLSAVESELRPGILPSFRVEDMVDDGYDEGDSDLVNTVASLLANCMRMYLGDGEPPVALSAQVITAHARASLRYLAERRAVLIGSHGGKGGAEWFERLTEYLTPISPLDTLPGADRRYYSALLRVVEHFRGSSAHRTRAELAEIAGCDRSSISRYTERLVADVPLVIAEGDPWRARAIWNDPPTVVQ